jgi:dTDP-4-dehydrorhamnose reductase
VKVLVTGSKGLLGRACIELAGERHDLVGVDLPDLDITEPDSVQRVVRELRPEVILHCAAYTDVDRAEQQARRAMEVNALGAEWVAKAAADQGVIMVYVSTDYVFDGECTRPYRETDPPRPCSRYGASKLEGERRVAECCPDDHLIVRTAWLYGEGAGFPDWVCRELDSETPLRLVSDHRGSPTYAHDLAEALYRLVEQDHRGVYHFVNKGETSWLEFGRTIAEMTGRLDVDFQSVTAAELGRAAKRPSYSVLAVDKYEDATGYSAAPWRDALGRYLEARKEQSVRIQG